MRWKKEEMEYLKRDYPKNPDKSQISKKLGRSNKAIQNKAIRMELSRPRFKSAKPSERQPKKIIDRRYYKKNKEKVNQRKRKRRRAIKEEAINLLGGKCSRCGYNKCFASLEFHHSKGEKENNLQFFLKNESRQKTLKEAKKCILLCANCHREFHHMGQ